MTDLQDFSLLERDHVGRSWLAGKESHFAKESALAQHRYRASLPAVVYLDLNPAAVNYEHRSTLVTGADYEFTRGKNMPHRGPGKFLDLFRRKRRENIDGRETLNDFSLRSNGGRSGRLSFDVQRARRKSEGNVGARECVPDSLTHKRVGVVMLGIVVQPVFHFPINR